VRVCVVGIGKIGLPIALQITSKGHSVVGADINKSLIDIVLAGREPFPGEAQLVEKLNHALQQGLFDATTDTASAVSDCDAVVVAVPLVVDQANRPDFCALDAATTAIAEGLTPGSLVSFETTVPVGTTRERFAPVLEAANGLTTGEDLFVCFSPERVLSGRIFADLRKYPKIVGGVDEPSTARGREFYEAVLDFDEREDLPRENGVWAVESSETAEFVKLAETTYRDVNIALANEFGQFADRAGINFDSVIAAANSQPYSHLHHPGIAVGGHCIPVYPHLYMWNDREARIPRTARQVNSSMPAYAVERLAELTGGLNGQIVVVLGAAYRGDVKEVAFSGVFPIVEELRLHGAEARVHDPLFSDDELRELGLSPYRMDDACDSALLQADHAMYSSLLPESLPGVKAMVDGRGVLDSSAWKSRGVSFAFLGRGDITKVS